MSDNIDLLKQHVKTINHDFREGVHHLDRGHLNTGLILLARSLFSLSHLLKDLGFDKKISEDHFFFRDKTSFLKDLRDFADLDIKKPDLNFGMDEEELYFFAGRLKKYLVRVKKEVCLREKKIKTPAYYKEKGKNLLRKYAVMLIAAGLIVMVGTVVQFVEKQKRKPYGLNGQYHLGVHLNNLVETRKDTEINFNWKYKGPTPGLIQHRDYFSVRWDGFLSVPEEGDYVLSFIADDMGVLRINGQEILRGQDWRIPHKKLVRLKKGPVPIQFDLLEYKGLARAELYWQPPGKKKPEIIPYKYLLPTKPE